ncbi:hypothetical protein ACQP1G_35320 [Nocardia sp. CA-107356]|uniref:hypothetical protein n=1 Tax=Nocardia sp. CA-107356 TaxID=3239972 RepID=UPI003D8F4459
MSTADLAPRCWWCGGIADSREHRIKASQLKKMFTDSDHLILDGKERPTRLNGPGAKPMLFPKVLCRQCNNVRSQPFDEAYDKFIQLVWDDPEYFRSRSSLDMQELYPEDPFGPQKLCRYYIKNIACRIAEAGFEVPPEMIDFMDGASYMPKAIIVLYKDFSNYDQFQRAGLSGHYPFANRMHSPEKPSVGPLEGFTAEVQNGPIGALFWWWHAEWSAGINFCSQRVVPLRERTELPHPELHQSEWDRADQMKRAQDIVARQSSRSGRSD